MRGVGLTPAKPFWADAWSRVIKRRGAIFGLCWIVVVLFFAVFAPLIANGHPILLRTIGPDGSILSTSSPLVNNLGSTDVALLAFFGVFTAWWFLPQSRSWVAPVACAAVFSMAALAWGIHQRSLGGWSMTDPWPKLGIVSLAALSLAAVGMVVPRNRRFVAALLVFAQMIVVLVVTYVLINRMSQRDLSDLFQWMKADRLIAFHASAGVALLVALVFVAVPGIALGVRRLGVVMSTAVLAASVSAMTWSRPLETFAYPEREAAGEVEATYVPIPFSPNQRFSELNRIEPLRKLSASPTYPVDSRPGRRTFILGTDALGADVLSQMIHACRLSISIGLVSTSIAVLIGVTIGALMGYFGGWVDLVLFRVVEIFMAVPVLFLLIVAVAVLPEELRSTYVIMAIIGCFTWTSAARFTRAEFLKLRSQDFVQAATAVGLPLRAVLFKHMLPNGVTPVLVDASFLIAAAILAEATLSYLGIGPVDQPSWGKLLSSAANTEGVFKWWLAIFPGMAIFLTVLSYNLIGEALRDAIDPKLRKAAH